MPGYSFHRSASHPFASQSTSPDRPRREVARFVTVRRRGSTVPTGPANVMTLKPDPAEPKVHVDIWHAPASADVPGPIESLCENWLTETERRDADRFRRPTTRNQHVVGRGMARRLLGGDAVRVDAIQFQTMRYGKPQVVAPEQARQPFNVAHTEGLVLCGIANMIEPSGGDSCCLGVDVERIDRTTDPGLAERFFAPPEIELLRDVDDEDQRREVFLRVWTLKESFIKAIGTGMQTPLADFAFEDVASDTPRLTILNPELRQTVRWQFRCFRPAPGFVAAAAIGHNGHGEFRLHCFQQWLRRVSGS